MKNFKKIVAVVLAAVLLVVASVAATVAYLTQRDINPQKNVFSVGDIDVSLKEDVAVEGAGSVTAGSTGADYTNLMPGDKLTKKITVTNDGVNPAYVALTVTMNNAKQINDAIDVYYENLGYTDAQIQAMYDKVFNGWGLRYNKVDDAGNALGMRLTNQLPIDSKLLRVDSTKTTGVGDYFFYAYENWFQTEAEENNTGYGMPIANGGYYASDLDPYTFNYTYYLYLAPGESFTPFEGLNVPAEFTREQLAMFKDLQINAVANAIQADNTLSAKNAFAALAGDIAANTAEVASAAELEAALENAVVGTKIVLTDDIAEVVALNNVKDVTIDADGNNAYFSVPAGANLTDVTITGLVGDGASRHVDIAAGSTVKNLVITDCTLADQHAAPYGAIYSANPEAEITVTDCDFVNCRYAVYGATPAKKLTIQNCTFENVSSWAVLLNGSDTTGAQLTIDGCTFNNCNGGVAKYLGSTQPEGAFTVFTGNTLTNCTGHDGHDTLWFTIPGAADTITVSGNTLDGAQWIPGTAQGLGK